jgi:mono/diheme cytochrome c family protein
MRDALAAAVGAGALAFAVVVLAVGIRDGDGGEGTTSATAAQATAARTEHESGRAVFARMGCGSCHTLAAARSAGNIGPNLDERLGRHTRASLIARITSPPSGADSFSAMPTDFGSRMNARELDSLVRFLLSAR